MLTYDYTARNTHTGDKVKGTVQAESEKAASKLVTEQGFAPIDIKLKGEAAGFLSGFKNRVRTKDRIIFTRQLSTMVNAGLPLVQSLRTVADQTDSRGLKIIINQVISDVEGGSALAVALEKHPKVFNNVYVSLVAAGEASGTLDKALERIANQQEKDAEMLSKVRGALVYPLIVVVVIMGVVTFMLVTVLPQVELLYRDLSQELPFITAAMLAVSKFIIKFWYLVIIGVGLLIFFMVRYFRSESGGRVADELKLNAPLFGRMFKKLYMARFARTATTLTSSGVPMLEMLRITGQSINNVIIEDGIKKAANKVKTGGALSDALKENPNFLSLLPQMIRIGEQSGSLDTMLEKTAQFYENELDNEIKTISTAIEPLLMVVLAVVAGLMVAAILLPVYGLVGKSLAV